MKSTCFANQLKRKPVRDRRRIDLHMHSNLSDGIMTVDELIEACQNQGLAAMSITDHDNIDAWEEGHELAEQKGIEFIPGVEVSSHWDGSDIHILGYFFNPHDLELNKALEELKETRWKRAEKIVEILQNRGIEICFNQVKSLASGECIGRAHIATLLVKEEYVGCFREAFDKYLSNEELGEIDSDRISPMRAIELIRNAGGVAVLAHPNKTNRDDLIPDLKDSGLEGIETFCHGMNRNSCTKYRQIAKKMGLVCSGGTDFHDPGAGYGMHVGSVKVPYHIITLLKERCS